MKAVKMADIYEKLSERLQSVNHVVTAFRQYTETYDKSLIKNLTNEELEKTLNIFSSHTADRETGWYRAIERELDRREKSKDYKIGFVRGITIGIIGGVISGLILWFIISKLIGE